MSGSTTAAELKEQIEAEREGLPFLVLRDGDDSQRIVTPADTRATVGRSEAADVSLPWDSEVSHVHAELLRVGDAWTVSDDGLSRNGTYINGERVTGRRRLRDGDVLRVGGTEIRFRAPGEKELAQTSIAIDVPPAADLSEAQRRVLIALCRPFKESGAHTTPATNQQIAGELFLSVDAVKGHLRVLFAKFDLEDLPQNVKRAKLVERALTSGAVTPREL